jgi:hypothetical protein
MRIRMVIAGAIFFSTAAAAWAQGDGQARQPAVQVRDGGTREVLESIFIPPTAHAPFQLTLATEWTRPLGNGGTYTLVNQRHIVRDSAGRIYQERWLLVPKGGKQESRMNVFQIADPAKRVYYNCFVAEGQCNLMNYGGSTATVFRPDLGATGPLPDGTGFRTHEELGASNIAGFDTQGYRDTTTINPGVYGNDQPMVTTREFWFAPQFGIDLLSKLDSPQSGKQSFTVIDLTTSEPEPRYFVVPEGYKIVDQRKNAEPKQ